MSEGGVLKQYVVGQFARPQGPVGWLAGRIMVARGSNRLRNRWAVALMGLQPDHRVLEVGHGPGLALAEICPQLVGGAAVGLDHSPAMHRAAHRRNRDAVEAGVLTLRTGSAEDPEVLADAARAGPFDRIFAVNVAMFWRDPVSVLRRLADLLAADGGIYLTYQPRTGALTDAAALAAADRLGGQMLAAGLGSVRVERLASLSPMAVCVIGAVNE